MSTLAEIEGAIKDLPEKEFSTLWEWMNSHAAQRGVERENPELEAALIGALESPRLEMDERFFADAHNSSAAVATLMAAEFSVRLPRMRPQIFSCRLSGMTETPVPM